MRVLILGGDGYLGWPTAMRFSARGHEVSVVDNFSRRALARETRHRLADADPRASTSGSPPGRRSPATRSAPTSGAIEDAAVPRAGDRRDQAGGGHPLRRAALGAVLDGRPRAGGRDAAHERDRDAQPALLSPRSRPRLPPGQARDDGRVRDPEHRHRGGLHRDRAQGPQGRLPFPKLPGSLYHLSKVHDSHNIHFACRIWGLRSTDLNQGVVYGIETDETAQDERLARASTTTSGSARCSTASACRPSSAIRSPSTARAARRAASSTSATRSSASSWPSTNPADAGEFRVFNQFTEQFSVAELAELVQRSAAELGFEIEIENIENPRVEAEEHYYNPVHTKLLDLGLKPSYLGDELVRSMLKTIERHRDRVIDSAIDPQTQWKPSGAPAAAR